MDHTPTPTAQLRRPDVNRPGPATEPALTATMLTKRYGSVTALDSVTLDLEPSTSTAVMGPSGSGKSTLLHCLAGFTRPDSGEVRLMGRPISGLGERAASRLRREQFGFVFQSDQLLPELPAVENVALPLMLGGMRRSAAIDVAAPWLAELGLDGMQDRRPGQLSGGQLQRVAIARALVVQPSVVFADEPTAALDRTTSHATMQVLTQASLAAGAALLVVTHDPEVASRCQRVVHMSDGQVLTIDRSPSTDRG